MTKNPNAVALGSIRSAKKSAASVANGKKGGRRSDAMDWLRRLHAAPPEIRCQTYNAWLTVATASHVRKHWRKWMGPKPAWACLTSGLPCIDPPSCVTDLRPLMRRSYSDVLRKLPASVLEARDRLVRADRERAEGHD